MQCGHTNQVSVTGANNLRASADPESGSPQQETCSPGTRGVLAYQATATRTRPAAPPNASHLGALRAPRLQRTRCTAVLAAPPTTISRSAGGICAPALREVGALGRRDAGRSALPSQVQPAQASQRQRVKVARRLSVRSILQTCQAGRQKPGSSSSPAFFDEI